MNVSPKAQSQLSLASSTLRAPREVITKYSAPSPYVLIFGILKQELSGMDSKAVKTSMPKILSLEESFPIYLTKFRGLQALVFQSNQGTKKILQMIVGCFLPRFTSHFSFSMRKPISISRKLPLHYCRQKNACFVAADVPSSRPSTSMPNRQGYANHH